MIQYSLKKGKRWGKGQGGRGKGKGCRGKGEGMQGEGGRDVGGRDVVGNNRLLARVSPYTSVVLPASMRAL